MLTGIYDRRHLHERSTRRKEDNIKIYFKEIRCKVMNCSDLEHDCGHSNEHPFSIK
jgi:hypothetical protein